jgi:hypothetical protein
MSSRSNTPDADDEGEALDAALQVARRVARNHRGAARKIAASDAPDAELWERALADLPDEADDRE